MPSTLTTRFLAILALFAFAAPAAAHRFEARLASPVSSRELVSSEIAWSCAGATCTADAPMSDAPARLCARFAKEVGRLEQFSVDGVAMPANAMGKCNAKAR